MNLTKDVPITSEFLLSNNVNDRIGTIETSQKMLSILNSILLSIKIKKKKKHLEIKTRGTTAAAKPRLQQQRLQQPPKTTKGVPMIAIPQDKLSCNKVGTTTILKFQKEVVPVLKRDVQNFRGGNLKNHLT